MKVLISIAIYAVPIWLKFIDNWTFKTGIEAAYSRSALSTISAFRTVSSDAGIAVTMHLKLVVEVEGRKHDTISG